ncbi:uncharacterized protein METZ01_LOCUS479173, partial [marine metagenome]
ENEIAKVGDTVEIMETRPISKTKNWRLVSVVKSLDSGKETKKEAEATS